LRERRGGVAGRDKRGGEAGWMKKGPGGSMKRIEKG
jgi:hypothetical protein